MLLIPIVRLIEDGAKVITYPVGYRHPPEQTADEITPENHKAYTRKRMIQLMNTYEALVAEGLL